MVLVVVVAGVGMSCAVAAVVLVVGDGVVGKSQAGRSSDPGRTTDPRGTATSAGSSRSSAGSAAASPSAASSWEASFHEALFQEASFQEALFQEALFQEALFQEASFQEALFQEALFQEALFQETEFQDAFAWAVLFQEALSKPAARAVKAAVTELLEREVRVRRVVLARRPRARLDDADAACAADICGPLAVSISAPLTWSGVKFGCRARMFAAAPATTGAANDVPAELHVAGRGDVAGALGDERRGRRHRPDHVAAGRRELGLGEAVDRVAPGRPRRNRGLLRVSRPVDVGGADRDHERIVAGAVDDAARAVGGAVVAGRRDDVMPLNQSCSTARSSGSM